MKPIDMKHSFPAPLLWVAVFALVAGFSSCSSGEKNDLTESNLKGRVKQITELVNNQVKDSLASDETDPTEEKTEYDVMRVLDFYPNGLLKNLRLITEDGTTIQKYEYDKDSLLSQVLQFADGRLVAYDLYTYDDQRRKQTRVIKDTADKTLVSIKYKYDRKGNLIEEQTEYPGMDMSSVLQYKYDRKGRRIEKQETRNGVNSDIVEKYEYNAQNDLEKVITVDQMKGQEPFSLTQRYLYLQTDSLGNWTVRETRSQIPGFGEAETILQRWERTIEYYP
ncbi:MAG TPA: hypothetical protein IAD30_05060 [Bacteroidetes bacterium]|nr:hypothetical protein [Bacteroidota bacterium]